MRNSKRLGSTRPKTKTETRQSPSKKAQVKVELVVGENEIGCASTARLVPSRRQPLGTFSCWLEIRRIPALGGSGSRFVWIDQMSSLITGLQEPHDSVSEFLPCFSPYLLLVLVLLLLPLVTQFEQS